MITIDAEVLADIRRHAGAEAPLECCGVLIGRGDAITSHARARNLAGSPTRFQLDPIDHIAAMRESRRNGLDVIGFYHSHPRTPAYPSETDIAECGYFGVLHLIAGVGEQGEELRLFRIREDGVEELAYSVV
ncbi:MAG: M67 family metallopeptidase [Vicinamibacterales bacterium]